MLHEIQYKGKPSVVGLKWRRNKGKPAQAPLNIIWADRVSYIEDENLTGYASAFSVAAGQVPKDEKLGTVLFILSDDDAQLFCYHVLVDGVCTIETEAVFTDLRNFLDTTASLLNEGQIDAVAGPEPLLEKISTNCKKIPYQELLEKYQPAVATIPTKKATSPLLLAGGITAVIIIAFTWVTVKPILVKYLEKPKEAISKVVHYKQRDKAMFIENCIDALSKEWPQAPGWELRAQGCVDLGMNDPELGNFKLTEAIVYRKFVLKSKRNPILARRVAEMVYAEQNYDVTITDNNLFATHKIDAPYVEVSPDSIKKNIDILRVTEDIFLGSADQITKNASAQNTVVIRSTEEMPIALQIANRSDDIDLAFAHRKGKNTYLGLQAPQITKSITDGVAQ